MVLTTNGKLHPSICGIALDAMVLDKNGGPRDGLVDRLLMWHKERRHHGPSAWREQGAGTVFHSSGFEDTQPPHELVNLRYG